LENRIAKVFGESDSERSTTECEILISDASGATHGVIERDCHITDIEADTSDGVDGVNADINADINADNWSSDGGADPDQNNDGGDDQDNDGRNKHGVDQNNANTVSMILTSGKNANTNDDNNSKNSGSNASFDPLAVWRKVQRKLEIPTNAAVLEVGSGTGVVGQHISQDVAHYVGVELDESLVARHVENFDQMSVNFDPADMPFGDESFDFVVCVAASQYFSDRESEYTQKVIQSIMIIGDKSRNSYNSLF
jgi:hypothetical protein